MVNAIGLDGRRTTLLEQAEQKQELCGAGLRIGSTFRALAKEEHKMQRNSWMNLPTGSVAVLPPAITRALFCWTQTHETSTQRSPCSAEGNSGEVNVERGGGASYLSG